jgi:two-component system nitrogen regulation sensor histidine kinase NtrY
LRRKYKPENEEDGAQFAEYLSIIGRQVDDIGRMVDEFSAFARMPQPVMAPLDLRALVAGQMTLFEDGDIVMSLDVDDKDQEFGVLGDAGLLRQAVSNLIQNSVDSLLDNHIKAPQIRLGLSRVDAMVILQVADNGPGYPEMDRSRLLEPYVTHREKGTGLGLAIVSKIVQDHAGTLELLDAPQGGACATIRLSFFEDMGSDQ